MPKKQTAFYQYSCELQIAIPHLAFRQATEIHMEKMLRRKISHTKTVDCLPMWYYFYCVDIEDPLTIMQHPNDDVELHPGQNRFIGRSIRGDKPWVPARIISIGQEWKYHLNGIREVRMLDNRTFEYETKEDFYSQVDLYTWSHGSYAPTRGDWLTYPERWAQQHLGEWGGKIYLPNRKVHIINRHAKKWLVEDVRSHPGLMSAVQELFRKLKQKQDKYLRKSLKAARD